MSISYEAVGRTRQKARTRKAIIAATRELLRAGRVPAVEEAADRADVSRATAYRYFPNQRKLLEATFDWLDEPSLVGDVEGDVEKRLSAVVQRIIAVVDEYEPVFRALLRLSLEPDGEPPTGMLLRAGRRLRWVQDALLPLRSDMPRADFERVVRAIAASIGVESLVWLTDVAGMAKADALGLMHWSAITLLRGARSR